MLSAVRILLVSLLLASCANGPNSINQVVVVETVVASIDAHEIERLVTAPLERAIDALVGVTEIRSRTTQ
jgi:multidrug efflux pump subunit AcrB